ncbi:hypothetical protein SBOR_2776 [Sclerotinia borealis F-4128]|uniref:Uncharacterized protein n=1 Tax=Sclerotinia borealis (strain F-4128) TaxID=1432307 RepID=W9CQV9_SCLBF|nr:hypothetical protein SBOR_2776 [Sclerotinia borealis F-4128]
MDRSSARILDPIPLDPASLYIILNDIGDQVEFHWALYLAKSPTEKTGTGNLYHATNRLGVSKFIFQEKVDSNLNSSVNFLVAVKIGDIEPYLWDSLGNMLHPPDQHPDGKMPIDDSTNCRSWVVKALELLDDYGYIKLKGESITKIQDQCRRAAADNWTSRERTVEKSGYSFA